MHISSGQNNYQYFSIIETLLIVLTSFISEICNIINLYFLFLHRYQIILIYEYFLLLQLRYLTL